MIKVNKDFTLDDIEHGVNVNIYISTFFSEFSSLDKALIFLINRFKFFAMSKYKIDKKSKISALIRSTTINSHIIESVGFSRRLHHNEEYIYKYLLYLFRNRQDIYLIKDSDIRYLSTINFILMIKHIKDAEDL
jgi:hypothetical protein